MNSYKTYYGRLSKAEFIEKCEKTVEYRKILRKLYKRALGILEGMDGKMANKKLADVVQKVFDDEGMDALATWRPGETWEKTRLKIALSLKKNLNETTYLWIKEKNGHFSIEDTISDSQNERTAKQIEESIKEHKDAIKNYDKYRKMTEKLREQVKEYNSKCNLLVRMDIREGF